MPSPRQREHSSERRNHHTQHKHRRRSGSREKRHRRSRSRSQEDKTNYRDKHRHSRRHDHHRDRKVDRHELRLSRPIKQEKKSPERKTDTKQRYKPSPVRDSYQNERERNDQRRRRRHEEVDDSNYTFGRPADNLPSESKAEEDKAKPDFALSGKLTEDTNTYKGVVIKYNEPPEAKKPVKKWRLYPFKGEEALPVLHIHRQSGYMFGRDRKVADIPVDHPSCSKQHAVLQFRCVELKKDNGSVGKRTKPYIIDLGSANGTFVNSKPIEPQRYVELLEKDTIKFGFSSRDYVILHDNVDTSEVADSD